jgi:conjugal transfer pilus assembly protein TraK
MKRNLLPTLTAICLAVMSLGSAAQTQSIEGPIRTASIGSPTQAPRAVVRGSVSVVKPAPTPAPVATPDVASTVAEPAPGKPTQPQSLVASEGVPHQEAVIAMAPPAPPAPPASLPVPQPIQTSAPVTPEPITSSVVNPPPVTPVSADSSRGATPAPWPSSLPVPGRTRSFNPPAESQQPATQELVTAAPAPLVTPPPGNKSVLPPSTQTALPAMQTQLPGVGTIPGAKRLGPNTVRVTENVVEEVMISMAFPNRISTPFVNPRVVDSSGSEITKDGGSVYIKPVNASPVAIYVTGDRPGDPVISLLLKPTDVGPQTVVLQLDEKQKQSAAIAAAAVEAAPTTPQAYTTKLVDIMKQVATGAAPHGFSGGPVPVSVGRMGDLMLRTETRYSGSNMEVHTYWVTNIAQRELALDESMFYADGVLAVAFFPETQLVPSGGTRVMVIAEVQTEGQ